MSLLSTVIFDLDLMQLSTHYNFITAGGLMVLRPLTWTGLVHSGQPVTLLEMNLMLNV